MIRDGTRSSETEARASASYSGCPLAVGRHASCLCPGERTLPPRVSDKVMGLDVIRAALRGVRPLSGFSPGGLALYEEWDKESSTYSSRKGRRGGGEKGDEGMNGRGKVRSQSIPVRCRAWTTPWRFSVCEEAYFPEIRRETGVVGDRFALTR